MTTRSLKFLFWLAALALVLACVPSLAASPLPTADANQVSQFIAQTANAAATQTAKVLPTSTSTATTTPTPRNTHTASPTFTSTVIFVLSSPTKPAPPTAFGGGGGGSSGGGGGSGSGGGSSNDYACQIVSVTPANGTTFKARDDFDTTWRVKNTGSKNWDRNNIDFTYLSGAKIHKVAGYDLPDDVNVGQSIDLSVDMVAPKDPGSYSTTWTLGVGSSTFCNMSISINVK